MNDSVKINATPFERGAGVLLHISSLPGPEPSGNLGIDAYRFIDFLAAAGFRYWQMLPITPTHSDGSPYLGYSSFAGNPSFICFDQLIADQLTSEDTKAIADGPQRWSALASDFKRFASTELKNHYQDFLTEQQSWLPDFVLFQFLKDSHDQQSWVDWPAADRDRTAGTNLNDTILDVYRIQQFLFFRQWHRLKDYAAQRGIQLIGDLPIFVAHDSADCWAHRELFELRDDGSPRKVSGVPPDYFSATGQRWGNPCFDWPAHQAENFRWWLARINHQLALFDALRIDHFRGFEAYWEIDSEEATATNGRWIKAPGHLLFQQLMTDLSPNNTQAEHHQTAAIIAEDLGIITPEVEALREQFGFPGMKILQFAFDGNHQNPYLPHNHIRNSVVYTGTHDNNTTVGWANELSHQDRQRIREYFGTTTEAIVHTLLRAALASVARVAIIPLQDILELDADRRMNTPGTKVDNWRFRFAWSEVKNETSERLLQLNRRYGRCA